MSTATEIINQVSNVLLVGDPIPPELSMVLYRVINGHNSAQRYVVQEYERIYGPLQTPEQTPLPEFPPYVPPARGRDIALKKIRKVHRGDTCAICLGDLEYHSLVARIECGHMFHEDCIRQWGLQNPVCPVCRADIPEPAESDFGCKYGGYGGVSRCGKPCPEGEDFCPKHQPKNYGVRCIALLKSGKRRGQECGCQALYGNRCGRHVKLVRK